MDTNAFAWTSIVVLGVWHGLNPGMGWLFAVALGMQDRQRRAVWRALLPLAAGHGMAIAGTVLVAGALGLVIPKAVLTWFVAITLVLFGVVKLVSSRHPRYGGMRVTPIELTTWSGLMATAHGAGLMVVPFVLGDSNTPETLHAHGAHMAAVAATPGMETAVVATLIHTVGYLLVTGLLAVIVYERLGLTLLRRLWVNLDLVWALALIATGLLTAVPMLSRIT
jgi:hypothetical protein